MHLSSTKLLGSYLRSAWRGTDATHVPLAVPEPESEMMWSEPLDRQLSLGPTLGDKGPVLLPLLCAALPLQSWRGPPAPAPAPPHYSEQSCYYGIAWALFLLGLGLPRPPGAFTRNSSISSLPPELSSDLATWGCVPFPQADYPLLPGLCVGSHLSETCCFSKSFLHSDFTRTVAFPVFSTDLCAV